jgi:hypothetical protein
MTKPKLPDVWVVFGDSFMRGAWEDRERAKSVCLKSDVLHRYAPVEKPKVCKWKENDPEGDMPGTFDGTCGVCWYVDLSLASKEEHFGGDMQFCPKCGGKIKVKR